jgi:hypothetical protein
MCHNLRGRELAEEARRSCAVGNHWHGRATQSESAMRLGGLLRCRGKR